MNDVLIVPGSQLYRTRSNPLPMWYEPYAEAQGNVEIAQFPTPPDQNWGVWSDELEGRMAQLRPGGLVVGHSLGAPATLLKLQEFLDRGQDKLRLSLLFVAPFLKVTEATRKYDTPSLSNFSDFVGRSVDLSRIRAALQGQVELMYAEDDPFLPPAKQGYDRVARELEACQVRLDRAGHFQGVDAGGHLDLLLGDSRCLMDERPRRGIERS